ncbi:MAG TPA: hypothetical protein VLT86_01520 [Vicinamibacterales bacterium]|nr:hypothetical protein [Vicinamibacterales bacterium]
MSLSRLAWVVAAIEAVGAAVAPPSPRPQPAGPPYRLVATLPSGVDGGQLRTFAFDPREKKVYAANNRGLYWMDLSEPDPRLKGPLTKKNILKIEIAPELGRVFYATPDEVGYVDLEHGGDVLLVGNILARDLVYEPTRQEVYVATRDPRLLVFDARSNRRGDPIPLPGWYGTELEAAGGRVFLSLGGKDGLYAIDAATHRIAPFKVSGRIVTPAYIEGDPSGQYLFLAYYREIVAIDIARAAVVGRLVTASRPTIAFDPGERLLVATWADEALPAGLAIDVFRPDGLTMVAHLENPAVGRVGVEPTNHGFVQAGHLALLVWSSTGG